MSQESVACGRWVELTSFPPDYVWVLEDILDQIEEVLWVRVWVDEGQLADHMEEWESEVDHWEPHDFDMAELYLGWMRKGRFGPPLVASDRGGLLNDGFHRMYGYLKLGHETAPFIYVDKQFQLRELGKQDG